MNKGDKMKKTKSNVKEVKKATDVKKLMKEKFEKFNKNEFKTIEVIFLIVITAIISLIVGYLLNNKNSLKTDSHIEEIIENYNYIVDNFYDSVDKDKLVSGAISGMSDALGDDYSKLLEQDNNSTFYINLEGTYEGIGVEIVNDEDNNIIVVGTIDNSPAEIAGIQTGDIIKKIDDKDFTNTTVSELSKYIKNTNNENYKIIIERDSKEITIEVKKDIVTIKSVLSKVIEKNNKKIGYIYISVFANATISQFDDALEELEREDIDGLIIDVRNNSGGHLTTAYSIVSNFLDSSKVVYQIKKDNKTTKYYSLGSKTKKYPIVVIQNGSSASASEFLSSALKESYGAKIVGTTSYGKGTVQEVVALKNGDTYKLTTKKWLTPKGNSIDGVGVKPDIEVELSENYTNSPSDDTDDQLQAAINSLLK